MSAEQPKNALHGLTLAAILGELVAAYGWAELSVMVPVQCFINNPSAPSSLKFLRRTPWARAKIESLYLWHLRELKRKAKADLGTAAPPAEVSPPASEPGGPESD